MKNKSRLLLLIIPLLLVINFYGCIENLNTSDEESDPKYPTTLYPLTEEKIQQLQKEFDLLNNHNICSIINEYGFLEMDRYLRPLQNIPISEDSALVLAINTLLKNSRYVNVKDSVQLIYSRYNIIQGNLELTRWKIIFGPQIYDGYELPFTRITVWTYGNEPQAISGHWYSDIYIPPKFKFDMKKAKERIVGQELIWHDFFGNPQKFLVTYESISDSISKAILPVEKENSIELRVTWKIPIIFSTNSIGWHIYVDVMNREIVKIVQEFRT